MQLERLNHKHKLNKQHVYVEYNWVGWQYPAEVWWGDESVSGNYWYEAEEGEGGNEMYRKDWTIYVRKKVLSARLHNDEISNKWQKPTVQPNLGHSEAYSFSGELLHLLVLKVL